MPEQPKLSDSQRRIVQYDRLDRHMLVIAPPGSGKTHTISERIAWLLNSGHAQSDEILALTYTNKAGHELKDRIAKWANPHVHASTMHSWSFDLLRKHGNELGLPEGFQVCDEFRRADIIRLALQAAGYDQVDEIEVAQVGKWIGQRKSNPNVPPVQRVAFRPETMESVDASYRHQMADQGLLDYEDLIWLAGQVLWEHPDIADPLHERVRYVFVDEYHDLSPDQFRLLTAIVPGRKPERQLLAVADPNQAIYGFRGGDAAEMLRRFRAEYRPQEFLLRENFRSTGQLVETSNHFIAAGDVPANSVPVRSGTDTPHLHRLPTDVEEAEWVASAIQAAHAKGREFQDIAVLYRTHQRATLVEHELLKAEVPVARIQANRFFDDRLVIEGFRYLQLIAALDDHRFEPAINWPRVLVDELTMMQLRTAARAHDLRLAELALRPDVLRATVTPLSALGIERFMDDLQRGVGRVDQARQGVDRILPFVRRRRDPIPQTERGNFRSTLRELARIVDGVADTLVEAVQEGIAIRVDFDADDADHGLAAGMLKRTLEAGFGTVVHLNSDSDQPAVPFSLVDLEMHAGPFTCTALVYRLCQRLDERFDRSRRQRFVVFDIEATSTHIPTAELLQIGAVVIEDGRVTGEPFMTWVRPSSPDAISPDVQRITGIHWRDVADAPEPAAALADFLAFAGETPLVGHNIDAYDLPLIRRLCGELGLPPPSRFSIDTLKIRRRLHPGEPASLDALLTPQEKRIRREHRADLDARLNARVFIDLMLEIGAERRVSSMANELPLVAASAALKGRTDPDNQLLQTAGRRSLELGQGWLLDAGSAGMAPDAGTRAEHALRAVELVTDPEDAHWQRIEQKWAAALDVFERTHSEHDLQTFLRWFQLAVSTSIEHADENRVAMMTIHAAKGREWPVVFMLGSEDDQYVFSSDPDDAESRRMFYVGMTRAQDVLVITHANRVNGRGKQPSRFLRDVLLPD